jgi:hypothetical protein
MFVDAIPQNSTGRMDTKAVQERLKDEDYRLPDRRTSSDPIRGVR